MTAPFRYLSVCSGIEAATVAWHGLDWKPVGFSEIDPFASAVLQHHFPTVPNFGDMTKHATWPIEPGTIDALVGGTPCQSFSIAGLRQGLADPRGNLALTFLAVADRLRPNWIIWENVPGVLSSGNGNDFRTFVNALVELRYHVAWRILDAQHFGVAQRRRRVFVVANAANWCNSAAVLFDAESLRRNPTPRAKARKGNTAGIGSGVAEIASSVTAKWSKGSGGPAGDECQNLVAVIPIQDGREFDKHQNGLGIGADGAPSYTIDTTGAASVATVAAVRRLTPVECERLQGFPDDWTDVPYKGKAAADGPRYRAIGNSMAVPVMTWIGRRIAAVEMAINADNNK